MTVAVCCVFALVWAITAVQSGEIDRNNDVLPPTCDSEVYCQGNLLHTLQMARLNDDSKTFVDMSMINDVETTLKNFNDLMIETGQSPTEEQLKTFVEENFKSESELDDWTPDDFNSQPLFISKIVDPEVKEFAQEIVDLWNLLGKKVNADVQENPDRHSLIYVPNGFMVPGGRFREYYYWDSYWIISGLLTCHMTSTAKGMIENFLYIVDKYGHVPNGGRVYYLQRSQPPLLSFMASRYYEETQDIEWLSENIELLEAEVAFWVKNRIFNISIDGKKYSFGLYNARSAGPRPESYYEDVITARNYETEELKNEMYIQLKSGAENGWDFSSRWIFDENGGTNADLSHLRTTRVIPVDLNAFLYGAFNNIAEFYTALGNEVKQTYWQEQAQIIYKTINEVLWNEEDGIWYDFDLELLKPRKLFAASHLTPLWTKAYDNSDTKSVSSLISSVVAYMLDQGIMDYPGGIPATIDNTGEQWDLPNAWPPLQAIIVDGLEKSETEEGKRWAREFAEKWVNANMIGFSRTGAMFEKYDANNAGDYGGGGEYDVQLGFGWSNGVVIDFISLYYT